MPVLSKWKSVAWWPVPAFALAIVLLKIIDPPGQFVSSSISLGLGFVCVTVASIVVTYLVSRSFLTTGSPALVLLGCGALALGISMMLASAIDNKPNTSVTVHNLGCLIAGFCHLFSAVISGRPGSVSYRAPALTVSYSAAVLSVLLIGYAASVNAVPTFFVQGEGGTPVRQGVIVTAAVLFALTALVLRLTPRGPMPSFSYWYALAMLLMATGLLGLTFQAAIGSAVNWTARAAQYVSGAYMLIAAVVSVRETRVWEVSLTSAFMELRQRWEDLFALADDGISVYEIDDSDLPVRVVQANPALARLLGYGPEQLKTLTPATVTTFDDRLALAELYRSTPDGGSFRKELTLIRADGRAVTVDVSTRLFRKDGARMGLSIIRDVTERKATERALQQVNAELQQFAYAISHDLQEPLRMVTIYAQLLERQSRNQLDAQGLEHLERVMQGARRMNTLMRGLRSYLHAGENTLETPRADVNRCLQEALATLEQSVQAAHASIGAGQLPPLHVAPVHLHQLFQNLVANAIKFRGEAPPRIEIWAEWNGSMWNLAVRDNGIGIAPEFHDQVFGMFKRLHSQERYEGSGIGLAICHKIVDRYGGKMWVESVEGAGSTFWLSLPGPAPTS